MYTDNICYLTVSWQADNMQYIFKKNFVSRSGFRRFYKIEIYMMCESAEGGFAYKSM